VINAAIRFDVARGFDYVMTSRYKDRSPALSVIVAIVVLLLALPVARSAGVSRDDVVLMLAIAAITVVCLIGLALLDRKPEP
jgi:hypothetical protein